MSEVLSSYSEANYNYDGWTTAYTRGQTFRVPTAFYNLAECAFWIRRNSTDATGTPAVRAKLYGHAGTYGSSGVPSGAPLATSSAKLFSELSTTYGWVTFAFPTPYLLSPDTPYCIAVEFDNDDTAEILIGIDTTSPTHNGNYFGGSETDGFGGETSRDLIFSVSGVESASIVVLGNYGEANYDTYSNIQGFSRGQTFTSPGGAYALKRCSFWMRRSGNTITGTPHVRAKLFAHSGTYGSTGVPTGSALSVSGDILQAGLSSASLGWVEFTFSSPYTLSPNTQYCIVIESDADATGGLYVGYDASSPTHAGNYFDNAGGSWAYNAGRDVIFKAIGEQAGQNVEIAPTTGAAAFAGVAPAVMAAGNVSLLASCPELVLCGVTPAVAAQRNVSILPQSGGIAFTGNAVTAVVQQNTAIFPLTGGIVFTGVAPLLNAARSIEIYADTGTILFDGGALHTLIWVPMTPLVLETLMISRAAMPIEMIPGILLPVRHRTAMLETIQIKSIEL